MKYSASYRVPNWTKILPINISILLSNIDVLDILLENIYILVLNIEISSRTLFLTDQRMKSCECSLNYAKTTGSVKFSLRHPEKN